MNADWTCSSKALPCEGQQVEFVLDHRGVAIEGAYTRQTFRSRWAEYVIERVLCWRERATSVPDDAASSDAETHSVFSDA
ncbi:MAG TPA: hypothetical protein PKC03_01900 [Dokdonella sp.]|nr:hypothetical protein [Dokdonella sp.]